MRYRLTIKTVSPLSISARHPVVGQATPSLDYIPGTALRGACAAELLLQGEPNTSDFFSGLFKSATAVWGNLYPLGDTEPDGPPRSLPIPLTALSCKRSPGFGKHRDRHGVIDSLIARLIGQDSHLSHCRQQNCDARLDDFGGFYIENTDWHLAQPGRRLIARTAIAGRWGTAQSGSLYTLEALNEEQYFSGYLDLPDKHDDKIRKLLQDEAILPVGVARRRGLGQIRVVRCVPLSEEPPELVKSLEERLDDFDGKLQVHCQDDRLRFVLTLYADTILLDDYQRYQTAVTEEALAREARFWPKQIHWPEDLRLERTFSRTRRVSGWNVAHGLPRPDALAIVVGSVAVFSIPRVSRAEAIKCLRQVETKGIGERTQEGFGRVIVGHPFHLQEGWV